MQQRFIIVGPSESRSKQRKVGIAKYVPPAGAIKVPCDQCGEKLWIGPKQQEAKSKSPEIEVVCTWCSFKERQREGGMAAMAHLGGQGGSYQMNNGATYGPNHGNQN